MQSHRPSKQNSSNKKVCITIKVFQFTKWSCNLFLSFFANWINLVWIDAKWLAVKQINKQNKSKYKNPPGTESLLLYVSYKKHLKSTEFWSLDNKHNTVSFKCLPENFPSQFTDILWFSYPLESNFSVFLHPWTD